MITECLVLFPVQHFQQRRTGITLIVTAHLIDLVQKQQRILHPCLSDRIDDPSWHSTHISLAMSSDLGLIPNAAQTDAHILLIQ